MIVAEVMQIVMHYVWCFSSVLCSSVHRSAGSAGRIRAELPGLLQQLPHHGQERRRCTAPPPLTHQPFSCIEFMHALQVRQGAMRVLLWKPKRGGGGQEGRAVDDDADAAGDDNGSSIEVEMRGELIEILTIVRNDLDANDATFTSTTNIR